MTENRNTPPEKESLDMNNFFMKLPDDHYPDIPGEPRIRSGSLRYDIYQHGNLDIKIGEKTTSPELHSDLYRTQTFRSFFAQIDELIEELGLREKIDEKITKLHDIKEERTQKRREILTDPSLSREEKIKIFRNLEEKGVEADVEGELFKVIRPVFEGMLEKGYLPYDLSY